MNNINNEKYEKAGDLYIEILETVMNGQIVENELVEQYASKIKPKYFHQLYTSIKKQMDIYLKFCECNDEYVKPDNMDAILALNYTKIMSRKPSWIFPNKETEQLFMQKFYQDSQANDFKTYMKTKRSK